MSTDRFLKVRATLDQHRLCHRAEVMARASRTCSSCSPWLPPRRLQDVAGDDGLSTANCQSMGAPADHDHRGPLGGRTSDGSRLLVPGIHQAARGVVLGPHSLLHSCALVFLDSMSAPSTVGDSPARRLEVLASVGVPSQEPFSAHSLRPLDGFTVGGTYGQEFQIASSRSGNTMARDRKSVV